MNLYKPSTAIIPGSGSDPSRSKVTTSSMFNNISASTRQQQSPQQQTQQPNRKIFVPSSLLLQHQPPHQPSQSQSQAANPYVNISQHYPEVRLRRPQISSVNPLFSNNHNNNNNNPNGVSDSKVKLLPRPSSYHSSSSRSSSFCDDTNTNTNANAQPNQFEYDFDGTPHPSAGPDCFVDPIERDLLENWLEVEFQQNFKRLHSLIRRCSSRSEANFDFETGNEILFLRRPATAISDVDSLQISSQRNGKPQNECHKSKNNNNNNTTSSYQLTNWLMARRSGGGGEAPKNVPKSRKSSTFEEFESFQPDEPSSPMQSVLSRSYPPWLSTRLATLERLLLCESRNEITQFTNSVKSYDSLICLAIAEPNDKAKRDALLYSYPPSSSDTESEFVPSILKLGGMFITLAEIFDILHSNRAFEHANGDQRAASNVQTCRIRVVPGSGVANEEFDPTISTKRNYVFTIIRDKFELEFDSKKPNKRSPAILLLVGLPECSGYSELDCRCMASLVEESLVARFGSLQRMFSPFFAPQNTQLSEKQLIRAHLSHTMSVYETLISPPSSEKSVDSTFGACSSLEAILTLSNSFFNPLDSVNMKVNCLPLRSLPADYSVTSQTCKLLNYYDSLDWLDESVTRFYRKDSMDLEHALSEHFARCLQWQCSSGSGSGETPSKPREDANNNENGKELQNDFDLLELELSSFTVKGSVLFFRGLLVQSNLAYSVLNPIYHRLFSKGLLALSKHLHSDLVYFTDFEEMEPCKDPAGQASNHFLLILGYGHLLHCSVVQVHCFDRSAPPPESTSSLNTPNGTLKSKNTDDPPHPGTLPSSFAFYVFIKESFRFLCSNFSSQNTNGPVDMHYEQQLENIYRLGQQIANENFSQLSQFDKKSKKKMSKRDKEFERRLALMEKANKKQRDKLDKMDVRSKVLVEGVVETGKRTSVGSLMDDERTRGSNAKSPDLVSSCRNSMIILPEGQQQHRLHPRSLPTSPVKSVSSRPVSMYSNWSFSSTATGASSFASSSSATSIGSSDNCNCETDSRKGFDTRSFISSITSRTTATSATCTSLADASELRYGSIYRFSHRYLPESLVAYLNIEPKSEVQAFYGPILDCGVILETTTNAEIPTKSLIVTSIVTELLRALQELRKTVRKLAELDSRRSVRNKVDGQKSGTISSGRIVKMHFDLITGRAMTESQFVVNSTLIVTFQFYLIGQCCATEQHGSIGDEFYACFKLNSSLPGTGSNHQSHSSPTSTTSNRPSRWSIGRLSLKLDSEASKARKARASLMVASAVDRSSEYELNRLDYLRGDFEELMQAVRHNRPV